MNGNNAEPQQATTELPASRSHTKPPIVDIDGENPIEKIVSKKKSKKGDKPMWSFLIDTQKRTVLGRDGRNWAKLAAFYTVFYFCSGCFFVTLLYVFALVLDRNIPTYYNTESTMAVRTTATVVGMGFRPQPLVDDNIIRITDDPRQQTRIASSLRLYRDVFLIQKADAKNEICSERNPATEIPPGTACAFNWFHVVPTEDHPCSDNNQYGFKSQAPCVLVKVNKVFGWMPQKGHMPPNIQELRGGPSNKSISDPDVYITCNGTNHVDNDGLTDLTYYSVESPEGSSKYGVIPNHFFPYRNAPDHVQPFVLVQFKKLPLNRLIGVTCRVWAPNIEHDARRLRGMVNFQLYRSSSRPKSNQDADE